MRLSLRTDLAFVLLAIMQNRKQQQNELQLEVMLTLDSMPESDEVGAILGMESVLI